MASSTVFEEVKKAMTEYYTLLSKMPHFSPNSLALPPLEGWPGVDVDGLKRLGMGDAAIEFVRHLPYLEPCINCEKAWITDRSSIIAFHRGQLWEPHHNRDRRVDGEECNSPLPPHVYFLGVVDDWQDENYLLLDTERGTIIEMQKPYGERTLTISDEEFDRLPEKDLWTAHRSIPATEFLATWMFRMQRLIVMPTPQLGNGSMPKIFRRVVEGPEEAVPLEGDAEWEEEYDDELSCMDIDDEIIDDPDMNKLELEPGEEILVDDRNEAPDPDDDENEDMHEGIEERPARIDNQSIESRSGVMDLPVTYHWKPAAEIHSIYKGNRWPYPDFDEKCCRAEVLALMEKKESAHMRSENAKSRMPQPTGEEQMKQDQQRIKENYLAEGRLWDEEKEKRLTISEWWDDYMEERRRSLDLDDGELKDYQSDG